MAPNCVPSASCNPPRRSFPMSFSQNGAARSALAPSAILFCALALTLSSPFRSIHICSVMPVAFTSQTKASIPAPSSSISGIAIFNTRCATRNWPPSGFVISGRTERGGEEAERLLPLVTATLDLGRQGLYTLAEPWYEVCLTKTRERFGDEHPNV